MRGVSINICHKLKLNIKQNKCKQSEFSKQHISTRTETKYLVENLTFIKTVTPDQKITIPAVSCQ